MAFYFSAKIQKLRCAVSVPHPFTDKSSSVLGRNVAFFHHGQTLGSCRQIFLGRLVRSILRQPAELSHLIHRRPTRQRFRHCLQCTMPISFRHTVALCLIQYFTGGFESGRHLPQDRINARRLNPLRQTLFDLVHERFAGEPPLSSFAHLFEQGPELCFRTAMR